MEQIQPQRIAYFDVLRILATFAVIVLHLSAQHWADTDVYSRAGKPSTFTTVPSAGLFRFL